ncbi:DUF2680 domain-containing protein [Desulforudis sp. 1088]|uniref:DUF2680 domain-containing protein n=1 Tax=Desulforudis sp. 1088 TaxID=3416137 RepID=UPI003CF8B256
MQKKLVLLLVLLTFAVVAAVPAFAATDPAADAKAWFDQKFAAKKAWVDQAVKDGRLTPEQGQALKNHFDQMYQWHKDNGFTCPIGGPGMGIGKGRGGGSGNGFGGGFGRYCGQGWATPAPAQS